MPKFDKDAWLKRAFAQRALFVSRCGRQVLVPVESDHKGRPIKWKSLQICTHRKSRRVYFQFTFEGVRKSVLLNRAVALRYIPNPAGLPEVNHKDGNKAHNWESNLEWDTRAGNEQHAAANGLKVNRGSGNANAKLTAAQAREIKMSQGLYGVSELAKDYGVSKRTIRDIWEGRTWTHL